jgi:hypothetical protein
MISSILVDALNNAREEMIKKSKMSCYNPKEDQ